MLVRAGYIRQLTSGVYSLLPLGQLVRRNIIEIIRQEMANIGGQEFLLPALQPLELWEESGRRDAVSDIMFCCKDRKGAELALGLTHEEVFTSIARTGLASYRQLPQIWYQIQTKFRDESRPKGGLLRVREFTMKDSYSFDLDDKGLDHAFHLHEQAYRRIFGRCGARYLIVEADSGAMGSNTSLEFMTLTPAGEDTLVLCATCNYASNLEKAASKVTFEAVSDLKDTNNGVAPEEFATPGIRTIYDLEQMPEGAPAEQQIKTLVYVTDNNVILVLVQGNQALNEAKLQSALGTPSLRQATEEEIVTALGAHPGSLGACGIRSGEKLPIKQIIADHRLYNRDNMVTGANKDDFHLRNVSLQRDITVDLWADLHTVQDREGCINCGGTLHLETGLEIGHIFKLGTRYSQSMNAAVLDAEGNKRPLVMGSYGIGVERLMAAIAELTHDESGLAWPVTVAPFIVAVVPVNIADEEQRAAAEKICAELSQLNISWLLDDRIERAGVKFNDAELIGLPFRVTVGKKISNGQVELMERTSRAKVDISLNEVAKLIKEKIAVM